MKNVIFSLLFLSTLAMAGYAPWGDKHWQTSVASVGALPVLGNLVGDVRIELTAFGEYVWNGASWQKISGGGGSSVTAISIATANGFAGSSSGGTTPILTLSETVTGIPVGNGTSFSSAASSDVIGLFTGCTGTDYLGADGACHPLPAGVTPGGANTDVQFNSAGSFGGDAGFTYGIGNAVLSGKISSATANVSSLTASMPVATDASDNLISATVTPPITFAAGALGCQTASGSQVGCLSSADWTTFNGKSPAGNYATSGSGDVDWNAPSGPGAVTTSLVATTNSTLTTLSALSLPYSQLTGAPTLYYQTVQSSASSETQRAKLNFTTGFTVSDDSGNGSTDVAMTYGPIPSPSPGAYMGVVAGAWAPVPAPSGGGSGTITAVQGISPITVIPSLGPIPIVSLGPVPQNLYGTGIDTSASTGILTYASGTPIVSSFTSAFINLWETVSTHAGDLIYSGLGGTPTVLPSSIPGNYLTQGASGPQWMPPSTIGTVVATYYLTSNATPGGGQINFDGQIIDNTSAVTTGSTWKFTAPYSGNYLINANIIPNSAAGQLVNLYKNNSLYASISQIISGNQTTGNITVPLQADDYIDIRLSGTGSLIGDALGSGQMSYISISLQAGAVAPGTVVASYGVGTGASTTSGTPINFDTRLIDNSSTVTTGIGSWNFTASSAGNYLVGGNAYLASGSTTEIDVYKNGTIYAGLGSVNTSSSQQLASVYVPLAVGDYIDFRPNATVTMQGFSAGRWNSMINISLATGGGNVSSTGAGQYHQEGAQFNCSTGTCSIGSQSGSWISSISRTTTGQYVLNFTAGEFSAAPWCTCMVGNTQRTCAGNTSTSSSIDIYTADLSSFEDNNFSVQCMGPH